MTTKTIARPIAPVDMLAQGRISQLRVARRVHRTALARRFFRACALNILLISSVSAIALSYLQNVRAMRWESAQQTALLEQILEASQNAQD